MPTAPSRAVGPEFRLDEEVSKSAPNNVLAWNSLARQLVADRGIDPPMASRYYALLSVAQARAARSDTPGKAHLSHRARLAAINTASAAVLDYMFPDDAAQIEASAHILDRTAESVGSSNVSAGTQVGLIAAESVVRRARTDRSDLQWSGTMPTGVGLWHSSASPQSPPLRPRWGEVQPWILERGDQFRPPPPPAFGSPGYLAALAEVRQISDTRTPEELRIALFWADGANTMTPPGHWNAIAADLIARYHIDEERAAEILARMNMAIMDAGIACWDAKYHYWFIRPPQADPAITTPVGLPNFPSYVSGHATFSGAASEVLAGLFPNESTQLRQMAEEAALSRLYAGIHYRFDNEVGLSVGRAIGALALRNGTRGSTSPSGGR